MHKTVHILIGLSFLGWLLLTAITFGIAGLYVYPYMYATYVNFYNELANKVPAVDIDQNGFYEQVINAEVIAEPTTDVETVVDSEPEVEVAPETEQQYGFEIEEDK